MSKVAAFVINIILNIINIVVILILMVNNDIKPFFSGYLQVYGQCKTNTSGAYFAGDQAKYDFVFLSL